MGYSCSQNAAIALDILLNLAVASCYKQQLAKHDPDGTRSKAGYNPVPSNVWIADDGKTYYFEQGRENRDGAITGQVIHLYPGTDGKEYGKLVGSAKINPDGHIARFPKMPKKVLGPVRDFVDKADGYELDQYQRLRALGYEERWQLLADKFNLI